MADQIIPIFKVKDAEMSSEWYQKLGFRVVDRHRFAPELPLYMFLDRNGQQLHLSEHLGDAKGPSLIYFWVDTGLDEIARVFNANIEQQPWALEIKLEDPDGNRLRLAQRNSGE